MPSDEDPTAAEQDDAEGSALVSVAETDELRRQRTRNERVIGAAIGVTMTRYGLSFADADDFLQGLADRHRRGLLDLARTITSSRWPPAEAFDRGRVASPVGRLAQTEAESAAGRLLDLLVDTPDLNDLLVAVADLAVEAIPGCDSASIILIRDGSPTTVAFSDERARRVDELQLSGGQGPCLQAARTDEVVEIHHLGWSPRLAGTWEEVAVQAGIYSVLALPIASRADVSAALNLYATTPDRWTPASQAMGEDLAIYTGDAITLAYRHGDPVDPANRVPDRDFRDVQDVQGADRQADIPT